MCASMYAAVPGAERPWLGENDDVVNQVAARALAQMRGAATCAAVGTQECCQPRARTRQRQGRRFRHLCTQLGQASKAYDWGGKR